jgi:hypothetical protein
MMSKSVESVVEEAALGWLAGLKTVCQDFRCGQGAEPFGKLYASNSPDGPGAPAASVTPYGKGQIAAIYFNLGSRYHDAATPASRKFLTALVRRLFPEPIVEVKGSQYVDVTVNRIGGKLAVNLVNTAGQHNSRSVAVFDEIPPIGPLEITLRLPDRPERITLQPDGRDMPFDYYAGQARLVLPRLEIHSILVVE